MIMVFGQCASIKGKKNWCNYRLGWALIGHSSCLVEVKGKNSESVAAFVRKCFVGWWVC